MKPPPPDAPSDPCEEAPDAKISAQVVITADDTFKLWVNGALIDEQPDGFSEAWRRPKLYGVTLFCHPSKRNVIAIEASNAISVNGPDRGLLVELRFNLAGMARTLVSDASWRAANAVPVGWNTPSFEDTGMGPAFVIGAVGIAPWNDVFATVAPGSKASWIWLNNPGGNTSDKPVEQTMFARCTFRPAEPGCL